MILLCLHRLGYRHGVLMSVYTGSIKRSRQRYLRLHYEPRFQHKTAMDQYRTLILRLLSPLLTGWFALVLDIYLSPHPPHVGLVRLFGVVDLLLPIVRLLPVVRPAFLKLLLL